MKERPIIMSAESVRAILAGRKTQMRRVVNGLTLPRCGKITEFGPSSTRGYDWTFRRRDMCWCDLTTAELMGRCPYGVHGDRLWVRETWAYVDGEVWYRTDMDWPRVDGVRLRPSIHMPRWASRFLLEITSLRAERVQGISYEDAIAEGMPNAGDFHAPTAEAGGVCRRVYQDSQGRRCTIFGAKAEFANFWDRLNARRGHPWEANDWVWIIEFRRIEGETRC